MRISLPALLLVLVAACGGYNTDNSVEFDANRYSLSEAGLTNAEIRFTRSLRLIRQHCIECHPTFASLTEAQFTTARTVEDGDLLAVAGNLDQSALWRVLRGGGAGNYMPPEYQLAAADIDTLRNWILNIGQP